MHRYATPADYPAYAALFPQLDTHDEVLSLSQWQTDLMPQTLVLERAGCVVAYTYFQVLAQAAYVRHLVVDEQQRGTGAGRALLAAVAEIALNHGCKEWRLNVMPENARAIGLYEAVGMRKAYESTALTLPWSSALPADPAGVSVERISDDGATERSMGLLAGSLANARMRPTNVLLQARLGATIVGVAVFDTSFPGAFPFKVAHPDMAAPLLRGIKTHANAADTFVHIVAEDDRPLRAWFLALGSTIRLDFVHYEGAL